MSADFLNEFATVRRRFDERVDTLLHELNNSRLGDWPLNSKIVIDFAMDDIREGWDLVRRFTEHLLEKDPAVVTQVITGLERLADGMYEAGTVLSRDEGIAKRHRSGAPAMARAARASKRSPITQIQVDIIEEELKSLRTKGPGLSQNKLAQSIYEAVNKQLKARGQKSISETTIWRRMRDFRLSV